MPLYEYVCERCSSDFEKLMRLSDPTPACPECGSDQVKKKVSAAAFALKGGGWYKDGYTGPSNAAPPAPSGSSGSDS